MQSKRALILFIFIILAISIPLTLLIRARIDLDMARDASVPEALPMQMESAPLPEPDVMISDDDPFVVPGGLTPDASVSHEAPLAPGEPAGGAPDRERCEAAGGHWNDCASPCRNLERDMACIEMCVSVCECGGIEEWTCPRDTVCTDYEPLPLSAASTGICR